MLHEQLTGDNGRMGPDDLDRLCPDWREREMFISGPNEMLDAFSEHYEQAGVPERVHMERFQPKLGLGDGEEGTGGDDHLPAAPTPRPSPTAASRSWSPARRPGLDLPYGCREGVCHTCVGELRSGRVRDLRTGKVHGEEGEVIRTCIHAPEGPIEIEL